MSGDQVAVEPKTKADQEKMGGRAHLAREGPSRVPHRSRRHDHQGMGQLHLA